MKYTAYITPGEKPGSWRLVQSLKIMGHIIPMNFETDGASIPWGFQWLIKKGGRLFAPAIMHDFFYQTGRHPRSVADALFLHAMWENGVGYWKRTIIYFAVRLFGWIFYKENKGGESAIKP